MEIEEAFDLLGLSIDATQDDVQSAYRDMTQFTHPDTVGGDSEKQKALNEARERAMAYCKIRNAVIPVNSRVLARNLQQALSRYTGSSAAEKARAIQRRKTQPIEILKWSTWAVAGITAALALFEKNIPLLFNLTDEVKKSFNAYLALLAIALGFTGLILQMIVTWNRHRIEAFLEKVSDKKECASLLAEALGYRDVPIVHETEFETHATRTHYKLNEELFPFSSSSADLKPVLFAKAVEHGLLIPEEAAELTPESVQTYRVDFKPALFKPPPPPPPVLPTPAGVRSELIFFIVGFAIFAGITSYLAVFKASLWSILPGLFALGFGGGSFDAFKRLRKLNTADLEVKSENADSGRNESSV